MGYMGAGQSSSSDPPRPHKANGDMQQRQLNPRAVKPLLARTSELWVSGPSMGRQRCPFVRALVRRASRRAMLPPGPGTFRRQRVVYYVHGTDTQYTVHSTSTD